MNLIHTVAMRTLPPFDALLAFDAVLRHGSMTAAAVELGITQSAVSHRIRRLEAFVGTTLLLRRRPGLKATGAGAALADGLQDIFDRMATLRDLGRAAAPQRPLRIGVGAALAHHWLVRRLPAFQAGNGTEVELILLADPDQASRAEIDIRIGWVPVQEGRSSSTQRLLFQERVFPVCHPALIPPGAPYGAPLLGTLPLLHKGGGRSRQGREWEWSTWFDRLGLGPPPAGLRFQEIGTAIAAALEGAGVALARSLLVYDALREGRLIRPLPADQSLPSSKAHVATWPATMSSDPRVRSFVGWLAEAAAETVTADAQSSA